MVSGKKVGHKHKITPKVNNASTSSPKTPPHIPNENNETPFTPFVFKADYAKDLLAMIRDEENKVKIKGLVSSSIDEFHKTLVHCDDDLWKLDQVSGNNTLNEFEYKKQFEPFENPILDEIIQWIKEEQPLNQLPDFSNTPVYDATNSSEGVAIPAQPLTTEYSKESGVVFMDPLDLVTLFMDVKRWSDCFYDNVSKAEVLETIHEGKKRPNDYDGALQLVSAEFTFPSPLVETRKYYFLRSCHKMLDCESWVVVDFSLDRIFPNPSAKYLKRPSGCLIQADEKAGYSRVTWIEHVEVDNSMVHNLFKPLVTSGYGFGAARWVATLKHQLARVSSYIDNVEVAIDEGRKSLLKLAERMTRSYILGISASSENTWKPLPVPGSEDILVRTKYNIDDVGSPRGVIVTVATTIWLKVQPNKVSDFLREAGNRHKWDLLSLIRPTQVVVSVSTDSDLKGCISILPILPSMPAIFNLQEVRMGSNATYIVYASIDMYALNTVLQGRNSSDVEILSSGFVVMPDRKPIDGEDIGGTLLTLSFQIADDKHATSSDHLPEKSIATFNRIVTESVSLVKAGLEENEN